MQRLIRIGSRKSELARLQAKLVGQAIESKGFSVEYVFREAPGDINLTNPLWQMPQVGVFTSFLHDYLVKGEVDVLVHSWKDLPIDPSPDSEVVATLPREDVRDLFMLKKDSLKQAWHTGELVVLTSSPRRQYNLKDFLPKIIPRIKTIDYIANLPVQQTPPSITFRDVRGNIQTRMKKLFLNDNSDQSPPDALVVAKAAVDRFLSAESEEFSLARKTVRETLDNCFWSVLPISANPTAAAQGALALEISNTCSREIRDLITSLNCKETFSACELERKVLKSLGGGCHQKIGCSVLPREYGNIFSLRGLTPTGQDVNVFEVRNNNKETEEHDKCVNPKIVCVGGKHGVSLFDRISLDNSELVNRLDTSTALYVSKAEALPEIVESEISNSIVWTAGVASWIKLASRGVWVNGCSDGLGESDDIGLSSIIGDMKWVKLTHKDGNRNDHMETIATYKLIETDDIKKSELSEASHIFWSSGSAFKRALEINPDIVNKHHGCGPGHTFRILCEYVPKHKITVTLNFEEFRRKNTRKQV